MTDEDAPAQLLSRATTDPHGVTPAELVDHLDEVDRKPLVEAFRSVVADGIDPETVTRIHTLAIDAQVRTRLTAGELLGTTAEAHPSLFEERIPDLVELAVDDLVCADAIRALEAVAETSPTTLFAEIKQLRPLFDRDPLIVQQGLIRILGSLADSRPAALAPVALELVEMVTADPLSPSPVNEPTSVRDTVALQISEECSQRQAIRETAARILVAVARADADAVASSVSTLCSCITNSDNHVLCELLLETLWTIADTEPAALGSREALFVEIACDSPTDEICAGAARVLSALIEARGADAVTEAVNAVDAAQPLLTADAPAVRASGASLLAYVAEYEPAAVESVRSSLRNRLHDDSASVRGSAVWALGYLGDADGALRDVAAADPDEDIRQLAATALNQ